MLECSQSPKSLAEGYQTFPVTTAPKLIARAWVAHQASASYYVMTPVIAGPKMIARAWVDPDFKARLLDDGQTAAHELDPGFTAPGWPLRGGLKGYIPPLTPPPTPIFPSCHHSH